MTNNLAAHFETMNRALTASEVAAVLGVRRDMIYSYAKCGEMPSINIGRTKPVLRFDPKQLAQWVRDRQCHPMRDPHAEVGLGVVE